MILEDYNQFGMNEQVAGTFRNILDYEGILAPHTNEPFTEALLMGIGGGLGAEYATWAFTPMDPTKAREAKLYLRFHHVKNYIEKNEETAFQKISSRLGMKLTHKKTASKEQADQFLRESLQTGKPVIVSLSVWQSRYMRKDVNDCYTQSPSFFPPLLYNEYVLFLPYYTLPYGWINSQLATIYGFEDTHLIHLADWSTQPHTITHNQFTKSRGIIKSQKNSSITLDPPEKPPNLEKAVRAGILDCVRSLLYEKRVLSGAQLRVEAWNDMANKIRNSKSKRGWFTIFNKPWQLFDTLTRLHAQISFLNSDGGALRSSYSDFLEEASQILKKPSLNMVANQFADIGIMWDEIGTAALPDTIGDFQAARLSALKWNNTFKVHGQSAYHKLEAIAEKIKTIRTNFIQKNTLTKKELGSLFDSLSIRFSDIYKAEKIALKALQLAIK